MQRRLVRMQDIASEVGVSPATVSLVLNNKATALRISSSVQSAVWEAAQRMGYRPNLSARRLRSSDPSALIIALVTTRESPLSLLNSVFAGAQLAAAASSVPVQITVEPYAQGHLDALPGLEDGLRFNGAIIANTGPADDRFLAHHQSVVPVVLFSRHVDGCSYIDATNYASGRMAADLLAQKGRQRLGVLYASALTQATNDRRQGFIDAAAQAGMSPVTEIVGATFNERGGYEGMSAFLETGQSCDGVFAVFDYLAFGAMHALRQAGRRIPADVALIGHDDHDLAGYVEPPLTTIHIPLVDMAQEATTTLVRILIGEEREPVQRTYQTHLVMRESV